VQQRRHRGQPDARGIRHRVHLDDGFSVLQRPGEVVDLQTLQVKGFVNRVQAIALGQEILERAGLCRVHGADRTIARPEIGIRGLARDAPLFEEPWRLLGRALVAGEHRAEGERALERALQVSPTPEAANALAALALQRRDVPRGIAFLRQSLALQPAQPDALHQLSMAYALAGDVARARLTAGELRRIAPTREGLAEWMQALGMR